MNNDLSPIKAYYTPYQLFMDAPPDDASAFIDRKKNMVTVVDNEILDPRNIHSVLENIQMLRGILEEKLHTA